MIFSVPDPAGFSDGRNLYAFVHNDPLTHFDEVGLFSVPLSGTCFLYEQRNQATNALLSHVTYEAYANFYVPLASEMDCYSRFTDRWMGRPLSERPWSEEKMWQERKTIDRFFGTHFSERDLALRTSGIQFSQLEIPTPSSLVSVAGKTSQLGKKR